MVRMGLGQACDGKRFNDCKRQYADHPSTRAGLPERLLSVEEHFVDVHNYIVFAVCVCIVLSIAG